MATFTLLDLIKPAMRMAGITALPGIGPSTDQTGELIPAMNRMVGSWNIDGHRIYSTAINRYPLSVGVSSYTIGPDGVLTIDGDPAPRPIWIERANLVITSSSPEIHRKLRILRTADDWARKQITAMPAAWPYDIYNDGNAPESTLYLWGVPTQVNDLELFTWASILPEFAAVTDAVVLPDGYHGAIVSNFALEVEQLYPREAKVLDATRKRAAQTLQALLVANARSPRLKSEAADLGRGAGLPWINPAYWR